MGVAEWASLAGGVGALLKERGETVAVAESSAGGLIAAALLAVPGASAYFKGGGVVYTGASKQILIGMSDAAMGAARAATEAHALQLARAARERLEADWGIGETGAAGPTGNRYGDAPGHSCIGIAGPVCRAVTVETGSTDRAENMAAFAAAALELLAACVQESVKGAEPPMSPAYLMKQHLIPNSDLRVSSLCYGLGGFGSRVKGAAMERLFASFREAGGNFFDTAHCYAFWLPEGAGCSERALGECLRRFGGRDEIVIGTKGGHPKVMPAYPRPDHYLAPELIAADIRDSRERLGVETIDLYYLHRDDPRLPVGEIIDSLNREIEQGRIRYLGASNWPVARIEEANNYAAAHGLRGFVASQPQWSLGEPNWQPGPEPMMRWVTDEDRAWYAAHSLAVIPYSSTANGYFATNGERGRDYQFSQNAARLQRAQELAAKLRCTPNQIALAYLMCQGFLVIPILGTADHAHLVDALGAAQVQLTPAQVRWLREG